MKFSSKSIRILLASLASTLALSGAMAQSNEMLPASSHTTARARDVFVHPVTPDTVAKMIDNQSGTGKSWTSFFLGQRRCFVSAINWHELCATIQNDGSVHLHGTYAFYTINQYIPTPLGTQLAAFGVAPCMFLPQYIDTIYAHPIYSNQSALTGSPIDWGLGIDSPGCHADPGATTW